MEVFFRISSHNMYVDVFFALKNNVLKQMLNVWIPSAKASRSCWTNNISSVSSRKQSVRLKMIKVFGEQTCIYSIICFGFEGGNITSDLFLVSILSICLVHRDKQTDLYERQRKMPGGKTLSTPCEGNTVMSDPGLFVGRNVGNIGKWWSDVECKKIEVDTGHSHEISSCASIYRFISIHVRWCLCKLHICIVINIWHQYRILILHPTPLSITQFWKVPNSRGFIPSDGLSLMDVFQKESYQVSE